MPANDSEIFQFPEVRVVEASAGSGKTYALASRYVRLLLSVSGGDPVSARNILALTFSKKAAFEMKARILDFLKKIAFQEFGPEQTRELLAGTGLSAGQAADRAHEIMDWIIRNYHYFQVQTIDKFMNALLSGCAFKIGLTAQFQIRTNADEYLSYALDRLIDQAAHKPETYALFTRFIHNYLYIENRSGWFAKKDILGLLKRLNNESSNYLKPFSNPTYAVDTMFEHKAKVLKDLRQLKEILPEKTNKRFVGSLEKFLSEHEKSFDLDQVPPALGKDEPPLNKGAELSADLEDLWQRIRRDLRQLCLHEAFGLFTPYLDIFDEVVGEMSGITSKDDVLFLNELNKRASHLFEEDAITVQEVYYRMASRYRHYLLDEFQDTSRLQWRNLEPMVEEALSTGGSLFYVGDRKQAIYSFRGGDADLFVDIQKAFQNYNIRHQQLSRNWRSREAVISFNNRIFSEENLGRFIGEKSRADQKKTGVSVEFLPEDVAYLSSVYGGAEQSFREDMPGGYVQMEYLDIGLKAEREEFLKERFLELMRSLGDEYLWSDIAVLTRGNKEIETYTQWLMEEGIKVYSERTSDVSQHRLIREIIAFLKFLNSPIDNVSFSEFVLGDILSAASGIDVKEFHHFLFSLRDRQKGGGYIYMEFRKAFPEVWEKYLEPFYRNVGLYPLYELLVSFYHTFGCLRRYPDDQGFLMHLLELVKKKEEDHLDLGSFLEAFENLEGDELYVRLSNKDAVNILTFHKSKGLEFPVVVIPSLEMGVQVTKSGSEAGASFVQYEAQDAIHLLRLKKAYYPFSPELEQIHSDLYKELFLSELNTVYVALTRARERLYGFIPKKAGNHANLVPLLIPRDCYQWGQPEKPAKKVTESEGRSLVPAEYKDSIGFLKDEFLGYSDLKNRHQRILGEAVHEILAELGGVLPESWEGFQSRVSPGLFKVSAAPEVFEKAWQMAERVALNQNLNQFFNAPGARVSSEAELVDAGGRSYRIDRLMEFDDEVWIVDFKSSDKGKESYLKQVQRYCELFQECSPDKKVRGFLIWLDSAEAEEIILE